MPLLRTTQEANEALRPYVQLVHSNLGKDTALNRIAPLMAAAGNPHEKLRIVHLAGTSGKTSTAYFAAALLRATGKKVGLTVSPHIDSVTERVQVDGQPLAEADFCRRLGEFLDIVQTMDEQPTYFEILYAFSFWIFAAEAVEYAVVETGMGGLYDPTNIARRTDKICIITDIGYDHMQVLGNTIEAIAAQKAGIMHRGNHTFAYHQSPEVDTVFDRRATAEGAVLHQTTPEAEMAAYGGGFDPQMPEYQRRNWLLAYAAYRFAAERDKLPALVPAQLLQTQAVQVPGRMDRRQVGDKILVMDGAHNAQKMAVFLDSFRRLYPDVRPAVLLAIKQGKEPVDIVDLVAAVASRIIITTFETSQDLPARSIDPLQLTTMFVRAGARDVSPEVNMHAAYERLLNGPEAVCIVTGSFYLLSQLREREHHSLH